MRKSWIISFTDLVSFWTAFFVVIFVRFGHSDYLDVLSTHTYPFLILFLTWIFVFYVFGLYNIFSIKPTTSNIQKYIISISISFVVGIFLFYLSPAFIIAPKINLLLQIILFGVLSYYLRYLLYKRYFLLASRPVILIGESIYIKNLNEIIKNNQQLGFKIFGSFDTIEKIYNSKIPTKNLMIIFDKIPKFKEKELVEILGSRLEIIDTATAYEKILQKIPLDLIDQDWIIKNIKTKEDQVFEFINKAIDLFFSITVLILTSPFILISAIFIYIEDKGKILYKQSRVGLNGKIFNIYKLRSMITDSEKNGAVWSSGNSDNRVTKIGKILRKTHLDEVPQMINIIRGDITLVGPRPERPEFVEKLEKEIPHYAMRHIVKPGFTGWAQIKYRYARTTDDSKEKFEYDFYYIKNKNFFLNIEIILKTVRIILTH